jgi:MFS family permease
MVLGLSTDGVILFATRFIRLYSYGFLSVGLLLYLSALGFTQLQIGVLFTGTLIGDLLITFYLTTTADSYGRKQVLIIGAILKVFAGVAFAVTDNFWLLLLAGIIGVISPTGGETGPFLAVEQAAITESISQPEKITLVFGYYNVAGYLAQAAGALSSGYLIYLLQSSFHYSDVDSYRSTLLAYSVFGFLKLVLYLGLSPAIEPLHSRDPHAPQHWLGKFGLHRPESRAVVIKLSLLFILDAFAGGFVMQTIIVYWYTAVAHSLSPSHLTRACTDCPLSPLLLSLLRFHERYGMGTAWLGLMMSAANVLAGLSALAATPLVNSIGAINTMVFTHFPSNVFLLLVPFMPNRTLAIVILLLRFTISQMDVPARQTYVATVVDADERSAAGGITNIVRSIGLAVSPLLAGYLLSDPSNTLLFSLPFIIAGGLKCLYDILLYISFSASQRRGGAGTGGAIVKPDAKLHQHSAPTGGYQHLNQDEYKTASDTALEADETGQTETSAAAATGGRVVIKTTRV